MTTYDRLAALERLSLFSGLTAAERDELLATAEVIHYPAGANLFAEGDVSEYFLIVLEGQVQVVKGMGADAGERLLRVLSGGDFLGEMSLFNAEPLRSAGARATSDVQALQFPLPPFENLLRHNSSLAFRLMQEAVGRLRGTEHNAIEALQDSNRRLAQSIIDLQSAQQQLIEQEKVAHELDMARRIQQSLLPQQVPQRPGWEIGAHWQPARAVGGDFYDFAELEDGRLAIIIGDATDKGVPAALLMAIARATLRTAGTLWGQSSTPGKVLKDVNELLVGEMPPRMFVTCFVALIDPASGGVEFANAGHCLPFSAGMGEAREWQARGMPLGLLPGMPYEDGYGVLEAGEFLLFYSDGLLEARNSAGEIFGRERIQSLVGGLSGLNAEQVLAVVRAAQAEFNAAAEMDDDTTLIVVRRER